MDPISALFVLALSVTLWRSTAEGTPSAAPVYRSHAGSPQEILGIELFSVSAMDHAAATFGLRLSGWREKAAKGTHRYVLLREGLGPDVRYEMVVLRGDGPVWRVEQVVGPMAAIPSPEGQEAAAHIAATFTQHEERERQTAADWGLDTLAPETAGPAFRRDKIPTSGGVTYRAAVPVQPQDRILKVYPDGWTVVSLQSQQSLQDEHVSMDIDCQLYWGPVSRGQTQVWSLRDGTGVPHITLAVSPRTQELDMAVGVRNIQSSFFQIGENARAALDRWMALPSAGDRPLLVNAQERPVAQFGDWTVYGLREQDQPRFNIDFSLLWPQKDRTATKLWVVRNGDGHPEAFLVVDTVKGTVQGAFGPEGGPLIGIRRGEKAMPAIAHWIGHPRETAPLLADALDQRK